MKSIAFVVALFIATISNAQVDTTKSVVITKNDSKEFDYRMKFAGHYQEISGVTQILGIVVLGTGTGLMIAHLKNGKSGFAQGAYACFGIGGALTITSAGFKIANGYEIRQMRLNNYDQYYYQRGQVQPK